ncbi:MAG TPA: class I SAM-dependent methyltransferase [Micromonosporaceae bacterium]|jgi:SAM-dependent methyltransferase
MIDEDGYFGERIAATYDDGDDMFSAETLAPTIDLLGELAGGGTAVEFAIGTGRVALPLSASGVDVCGIDMSRAMVAQMRAKPDGDAIRVEIGDMTTVNMGTGFSLAYLVYNTVMNLTTQDLQIECFANAARHLKQGGFFVIEVGLPPLRLLPPGQRAVPFATEPDACAYDLIDTSTQFLSSNYWTVADGLHSIPFRYVWPGELDLMARMAGMRLHERYADWNREPFAHESTKHVSVWRKI